MLEAICYGLLGITSNGAKKNELIRYGQKNGSVTLTLSNDYKIIKDFKDGSKLIDNKGNIVSEKSSEIEYYLNLDKDVFMNILYSSQNEIYSYFVKFNAKEKDFIDSIFNLDALTDKVSLFLKNSIMELNMKYNEIQSNYNIKKNLEDSISNILHSYNMNSVNELERALEVAKYNFQELSKKNILYKQKESILKDIDLNKKLLLDINKRIEILENNNDNNVLDKLKSDFLIYLSKIEKELNTSIDVNNLQSLYTMFDNNTNISTHLNYIKGYSQEGLNNISNSNRIKECFNFISNEVDTIGMLDKYRSYYQQIKNTIQQFTYNINIQVNNSKEKINSLNREKNQLDTIVREINRLEDQLKNLNVSEDIKDIEQFTNMAMKNQAQYTQLRTTLDNVITYQKQLDALTTIGTIDDLNNITKYISSIEKIIPIFSRDGFVQHLRSNLLKEIATSIGDSLEKFGFTKLIPVTIDEKSGALLFHNRLFRSLSGGERTIVALLLKILYSKLLAPNMKINTLLLDEPNSELDSIRTGYLRELLIKINKSLNMQIIIVSHDSELVSDSANKIIIK